MDDYESIDDFDVKDTTRIQYSQNNQGFDCGYKR